VPPSGEPLARLQRGLEHLYRIDSRLAVGDFVVDAAARDRLGLARAPREQLLIQEADGELAIGLFVDDAVLANLVRHDPMEALDERNLAAFLLAVEGVSHFVYTVFCAQADRSVSALELELQAEVDKYITCLLVVDGARDQSAQLRRRLFEDFSLEPDLDDDERDRYRAANDNASRYSASLERRFVDARRTPDMLGELRRFYRMSLPAKLDFIQQAA
jgi:hypothetical protein